MKASIEDLQPGDMFHVVDYGVVVTVIAISDHTRFRSWYDLTLLVDGHIRTATWSPTTRINVIQGCSEWNGPQ